MIQRGLAFGIASLRDQASRIFGAQRAARTPMPDVSEDEMSNYYRILHCAQCGTPIQARREGSKGPVKRLCEACKMRLRTRTRTKAR